MLEQFLKYFSPWKRPTLEHFVQDYVPWEGPHGEVGGQREEEEGAERSCYTWTTDPFSHPLERAQGSR